MKASMPAFQLIKRGKHSIVMAPYLIQHYSIKHLNASNTTFNTAKYCYPVALHYTTMHLGWARKKSHYKVYTHSTLFVLYCFIHIAYTVPYIRPSSPVAGSLKPQV